jgi:hypothetical protein
MLLNYPWEGGNIGAFANALYLVDSHEGFGSFRPRGAGALTPSDVSVTQVVDRPHALGSKEGFCAGGEVLVIPRRKFDGFLSQEIPTKNLRPR